MKAYFDNVIHKIRFNSPLRLFLDGLRHFRITIMPFYLFREDVYNSAIEATALKEAVLGDSECEFCYLGSDDMNEMAKLPLRSKSATELQIMLEEDKQCLAVKVDGNIVAFSWYDLKACSFEGEGYILADNEAYLFDAYTRPDYRGMNLIPQIRKKLYGDLSVLGCNNFLSVSECFNRPAIRFKQKLGARIEKLSIYINLFNFITFTIPVKKYTYTGR